RAPYRWSVVAGSPLPDGMTLLNSGVLSGSASRTGDFQFVVAVTDAASSTVNLAFRLSVVAIQIVDPGVLPPVPVGQLFSLQLTAVGGAGGYVWSLPPPNCPLALSADGLLSGTPDVAEFLSCRVSVTDALGNNASRYVYINTGG